MTGAWLWGSGLGGWSWRPGSGAHCPDWLRIPTESVGGNADCYQPLPQPYTTKKLMVSWGDRLMLGHLQGRKRTVQSTSIPGWPSFSLTIWGAAQVPHLPGQSSLVHVTGAANSDLCGYRKLCSCAGVSASTLTQARRVRIQPALGPGAASVKGQSPCPPGAHHVAPGDVGDVITPGAGTS